MLKKEITFKDYNDETVTEIHYFNMSKVELVLLENSYSGGLEKFITAISEAQNSAQVLAEFQKIILMSYGERTPDGKHFLKSEEAKTLFSQSAAYDALFMELMSDAKNAALFVQGIIPAELLEEVKKEAAENDLKAKTAERLGIPSTADLAKQVEEQ